MRKSKVLSFVLVAALAVTAIPINAFGTVSDEKNKLSDLQNQKQQAQDENNKLQKSKSDAQEYIQSVDKKLTNQKQKTRYLRLRRNWIRLRLA